MQRRQFLGLAALFSYLSPSTSTPKHRTGVVLDDGYFSHHISSAHPESPARYEAIKAALVVQNWYQQITSLSPLARDKVIPWLATVHSQPHIDAIKKNKAIFRDVLLATAGCLSAVDAVIKGQVRNAFCASRPPGHHALNTGREEGFCYFNHIAIAAKYAQQHYDVEKVLIIDWDYHHGNGTEWAFYSDPSVLFFSTHDQFAYPGTGSPLKRGSGKAEGLNINVHLDCGSGNEAILSAFNTHLLPALNSFKPDLILISAGFDGREDDLLGCFSITDLGFYELTRWVMARADEMCQGRVVSILEGGYNLTGNASAAISHINALRQN